MHPGIVTRHLMTALGVCLLMCFSGCATPRRVEPDVTAATLGAYQLAARQGDARAQYRLANCYAQGVVVKQDRAEAFRWYQAAAAQGDAQASFQVGYCLAHGLGVERDPERALPWLRLANGQQVTQRWTARLYRERMDSEETALTLLGGLLWSPLLIGGAGAGGGLTLPPGGWTPSGVGAAK
jgi:hypothetical protein